MKDEVWKDVMGFEGQYKVSSIGRIKTLSRKLYVGNGHYRTTKEYIRKVHPNKNTRYLTITLGSKKRCYVHRIVAIAFLGDKSPLVINHKNGIKQDNRIENLEWVTSSQNNIDALKNGLRKPAQPKRGAESCLAKKVKRTNPDTGEVKIYGCSKDAAEDLGIQRQSNSDINEMCQGKRKHLYKGFKFEYI